MRKNDIKSKSKAEKDFVETAKNEERKFSYINPVINKDFNSKFLFWDNLLEIIGRSLIIGGRLIALIISIIVIVTFKNDALAGEFKGSIQSFFEKYGAYVVAGTIVLEIFLSFLYFVPQVLVKKVNSLHAWGLTYIYFAVIYFLFWEAGIIAMSVLNSIEGSSSSGGLNALTADIIALMVVVLLTTIILIAGGSLLVAKSDDVRRQLTTE